MHVVAGNAAVAEGRAEAAAQPRVAVVRVNGAFHIVAAEAIAGGSLIFRIEGLFYARPTFTSVQVDAERHIDVDRSLDLIEHLDRYPWRFMNHSCDANALIKRLEVIAARNIRAGEEVAFNYNTTEYEMAQPFPCACGSVFCVGSVRGFRHVCAGERRRLRPLLAPHLLTVAHDLDAAVELERTP